MGTQGSMQLYPGDRLRWEGEKLLDDSGFVLATAPTVAQAGRLADPAIEVSTGDRILLDPVKSFLHLRLTGSPADSGEVWSVAQKGLTVTKLVADCAGRNYTLNRPRLTTMRREIRSVEAGSVVAVAKPAARGELQVFVSDEVPTADLAFMTWALTLVDVPARRTKI
ncbi:MAG: hypothetical protein SPI77_09455 [Corynebacterium sp.]|nr:hypothetical protein [Corynebacterium sp.]